MPRANDIVRSSQASGRALFYVTDVQFSSVALIDDVGDLVERVSYDAYGRGRHRPLGDLDGDGDVDGVSGSPGTGDQALMDAAMTTYNADADFDRDMDVDASDDAIFDAAHGTAALALGAIADDSTTGTRNPVGYDGYLYNPEVEMYTVRFRHYHSEHEKW